MAFQAPNVELLDEATEFGTTLRLGSDFLPVGFSAVAGLGYRLLHGQAGMTAVAIAFSMAMVVSAWIFLRTMGVGVRATFVLCALLTLYPDVLLSMNKVIDTNATALLLFGFVTALALVVGGGGRFGWPDVALAFVLGYAILVRPNMLPLLPAAWFVLWRFGVPHAAARAAVQFLIVGALYLSVTTAIHGRPFWPQNGPYNFCAGANEFTEAPITEANPNLEDSLAPLLASHGIRVGSEPGADDSSPRDTRLNSFYMHTTTAFIRDHPATMARYTALKLWNLLRPDFRVHRPRSFGGVLKMVETLGVPLWLAAFLFLPHPGPLQMRLIVPLTVVLYVLPFVLTISTQRFGVPLQIFCWVDLGAILAYRNAGAQSSAQTSGVSRSSRA